MSAINDTYTILDQYGQHTCGDLMHQCLTNKGIVHCSPDSVLFASPSKDDPLCLNILWACGNLSLVWRILRTYASLYDRISFQRELKGHASWHTYPFDRVLKHDPERMKDFFAADFDLLLIDQQ